MSEDNESYLYYLKAHREVRAERSKYYERLALLDGGTIALAATTLFGHNPAQLRHKYTLAMGLAVLMVSLICLLIRNLIETTREEFMTTQHYYLLLDKSESADKMQPLIDQLRRRTLVMEMIGVFCTVVGMTLLASVLVLSTI